MLAWIDVALLFAEGQAAKEPPWWSMLPMFLAIAVLFYLLILRPQQSEQKKRDDLLSTLKKNDRVVTIGGIIGSVANISADGKEITLKVDDNTRIKFIRSGIARKLDDEAKDEAAKPA